MAWFVYKNLVIAGCIVKARLKWSHTRKILWGFLRVLRGHKNIYNSAPTKFLKLMAQKMLYPKRYVVIMLCNVQPFYVHEMWWETRRNNSDSHVDERHLNAQNVFFFFFFIHNGLKCHSYSIQVTALKTAKSALQLQAYVTKPLTSNHSILKPIIVYLLVEHLSHVFLERILCM